jgi:hypothetical protein
MFVRRDEGQSPLGKYLMFVYPGRGHIRVASRRAFERHTLIIIYIDLPILAFGSHTELFSGNHINHIPSWKRIRSILDTLILPDEEVA